MAKKSSTKKAATKTGGKSVLNLDMTGVEGRKGARHYKEGDYLVKVKKQSVGKSKEKETPQVVFEYEFRDGEYKGKTMYDRINLLPQSLWVLRNALEAMGFKVPEKKFKFDLKKTLDKGLAITIEDYEYEGKIRSRVTDRFPESEFEANVMEDEDEEEEDDEETEDEETDEDEEEETEEDEDEDDEDEDLDEIDLDEV